MGKNMSWNQYSESKLIELEQQILSTLKSPYETFYLPVKLDSGSEEKVWTISLNADSTNSPLVLVHGFAAGIGFWCQNLDDLAKDRPVYAMDLLGFGRSSRPTFSYDSLVAEEQMVDGLEAWRKAMNLKKIHILGHSLGGFISASYAIKHPDKVLHLLLADPWGFSDHHHEKPSFWSNLKFTIFYVRPLEVVRAIGPIGPWLMQRARSDIGMKFEGVLEDKTVMPSYVYQCNAQNPTGERAFYSMVWGFGWSKNPMIHRMHNLRNDVAVTVIYGSNTWMDKSIGQIIKDMRSGSRVEVKEIDDTGHHLYSEQAAKFNEIVMEACNSVDELCQPTKIMQNSEIHENSEQLS